MTMPILQNRDYTLSVAGTMGRNSVVAMLGNYMVIGRLKNNTITFRITDFTEEDTIVLICPEGGSITHAQLERGNKASDWTPAPEDAQEYTENKVAEAKKYVDDLEVGGRNLIVQSTITRGKFLTVTGSESINAGWFYTDFIPVSNYKNLVTSGYSILGDSPSVVYYNSSKVFVKGINNGNLERAKNITIDSGIAFIRFSGMLVDLPTLKLEKGNKATDWTPAPEDVDASIATIQSDLTVEAGKITALNTKTTAHETQIGTLTSSYDGLSSTVTQVKNNLEGIQVGGENLLLNTSFNKDTLSSWNINGAVTGSIDSTNQFEGVNSLKLVFTASGAPSGDTTRLFQHNSTGAGNAFMMTSSVYVKADKQVVVGLRNGDSVKRTTIETSWQKISQTEIGDKFLLWAESACTLWVSKPKTEKGTVPTDWTPAPEDARTYKAWANSSDGTIDFTRVYPNENLISKDVVIDKSSINATGVVISSPHTFTTEKIEVTSGVEYTIKNHSASAAAGETIRIIEYNSSGAMTKYDNTVYGVGTVKLASTTTHVRANVGTPGGEYNNDAKLEKGTTPTIYTTNPADSLTESVPKYVGFSPLDSDKSSDYEWIINPGWAESSSSSRIEQTSESIMATVTESFVAEEDYTKYREDIATQFTQTAEDFNLLFSTVSEEVKKVESGSETKFEKIEKYIRFVGGKIVLGTSDSDSVLEISNDRISFMQGGHEVAHFAGQTFTISKGILTDSMQVGDHKMTKNAGGLTTFDYIP